MVHVVIWRSRAASWRAAWLAGLAIGAMASSPPVHAEDIATAATSATSSPVPATVGSASSDPAPDKSGYNLFNPTPDDEMRKFTPDRPAKGFSVRTIDAGHFALETDIVNYTTSNDRGTVTRSIEALDPTVKLGLTNWMDFEVQFNGLQSSRSFDSASGNEVLNGAGFGDVFLKTKMNLFGNDSGPPVSP